MNFIYYNVSGVIMEILQFLLSFFMSEMGGGKLEPVLKALKENNFDIKSLLKNLNPEIIAPIIKDFMSKNEQNRPSGTHGRSVGLSPVAGIADKDIVYTLNKYFYTETQ